MKPSEYCKSILKYSNVKSYDFINKYFSETKDLVNSIKEYSRKTKRGKGEFMLEDLLIDKQ